MLFVVLVLGLNSRVSHILGVPSSDELHPPSHFVIFPVDDLVPGASYYLTQFMCLDDWSIAYNLIAFTSS